MKGITAFIMLLVGIAIGIHVHSTPDVTRAAPSHTVAAAPAPTVTVTVTKTKTVTQHVPTIPQSCRDAMDLLAKMQPLMQQVINEPELERDIQSKAGMAIRAKDLKELTTAGDLNNDARNRMANAGSELLDDWQAYQADVNQCNADLK